MSEGGIKTEPVECAVCGAGPAQALDAAAAGVLTRHAPLLAAFAECRACITCTRLLVSLQRAEDEYTRSKAAFEAVLARNPLYSVQVKTEPQEPDSEDEPLAATKLKHSKRKKRTSGKKIKKNSKKINDDDSCEPGDAEDSELILPLDVVKKEDSLDGSDCDFPPLEEMAVKQELAEPQRGRAGRRGRPRRGTARGHTARGASKDLHHCDQCPNKYTSLKRLEQHREKHSKGPYICEVCGAAYKHKRACDIHVALHRGISDWKCVECDKLFPSRGALQRHNNIHSGRACYQCDQCGKAFIHTSSFKMHKLSHSGLKAHACAVCGLRLMTRSHLKRHARVHSGEKRHECSLCGKRFSERYNLVAHSRAHAADGDGPAAGAAAAAAAAAAANGAVRRRLFRCTYCPERFERRYMLERHTAVTHGRTLERAPPTPRNTMSKLLKAQALGLAAPPAAVQPPQPAVSQPPAVQSAAVQTVDGSLKEERSPEAHKFTSPAAASAWAGAFHEFGLRPCAQPPH